MKTFAYCLFIFLSISLIACNRQTDEEKIREDVTKAHEKVMEYLEDQHHLRAELLQEKIRLINDNIEKLDDVSGDSHKSVQQGLQDPLVKLRAEKELYQAKLSELNAKMDQASSLLEDQYKDYFQKLNIVLNNTKNYLDSNAPEAIVSE